jgi:hypothetical protein
MIVVRRWSERMLCTRERGCGCECDGNAQMVRDDAVAKRAGDQLVIIDPQNRRRLGQGCDRHQLDSGLDSGGRCMIRPQRRAEHRVTT